MNDWHLPAAFRFAGVVTGLRSEPDRRDVAVIASDRPASAAGVFTQNRVVAAPVVLSRQRVPRADARAVVVCSGNANACTGDQGLADAARMAELAAAGVGCVPEQVLVASTGVIGRPLPDERSVEPGIREGRPPRSPPTSPAFDADGPRHPHDRYRRIKVFTRSLTLERRRGPPDRRSPRGRR